MAVENLTPFNQLIGALKVYVAPFGTAVPDVDDAPGGGWTLLGPTDGGQQIAHMGALTYFRDDDHQGPVKAVRPEEDVRVSMTVVGLTLENYARILHAAGNVDTAAGPPATKTTHLKRGATPTQYAMLLRGTTMSPYGNFPGQYVIPKGVFDGEPEPAFTKDGRAALATEFRALEDDTQVDTDKSLGYLVVQTA
jgi:hypothetical protein